MPLRVVEKDGFLYAVNGCGHCPFNGWDGHTITFCSHGDAKEDEGLLYRDRIPVWCPLPVPRYKSNLPGMKEIEDNIKKRGLGG